MKVLKALEVNKTQYTIIDDETIGEQAWSSKKTNSIVGNIEAAMDVIIAEQEAIIAIQEALIGGDAS